MGEICDGSFYPFLNGSGDFDLDEFAQRLQLDHVQKELFYELIKQLEIKIWFSEKLADGSPRLEINVFWFEDHISGLNLIDLLKGPFETYVGEINPEKEIEVLSALKTKIDNAIELRWEESIS
jgi:hypothetical protein